MAKKRVVKKKSVNPAKRTKASKNAAIKSPVKAKFTLKSLKGNTPRSPDATRKAVDKIVKQAETESGVKSGDVKVYPNLESFAVSGSPKLVKSLASHKDVAAKLPDVSSDDVMIRPVHKRKVKLKDESSSRSRE